MSNALFSICLWQDNHLLRPTQFTIRNADEPRMALRHFEVSGEDGDGTVHSFHTDNGDQADDIAAIFREDLDNVQVHCHQLGA